VHFTKLRLSGFKSFVDSTDLVIGEGMTGVVGPNGCGKSNLVEALRWVMGENSAKRMRGGAMDDVIFSGTQSRSARNLAEVVLLIDNTDRKAPAAFNDADELQISRAIERESGSTYRVNGAEVRARDVQLLFADAASGAHSPALVSQGRIGAIINAKPTDRRSLLEEAAGITGLHSRRHEADLRLRGAEANLERLDDVMQALEAQLQNMKRQARQANRYRKLGEQIRHDEGIQLHLLYSRAQAQIAEAEAQLNAANRRVGELTEEVARANREHVAAGEVLPGLRQTEAEAGARLHRLAVARDALDQEDARIAEAQKQLEERIRQIEVDVARTSALAEDAAKAIADLQQERDGLAKQQEGEEAAQTAAAERVNEVSGALSAQETELEALTDKVANLTAQRDALARAQREASDRLVRLQNRNKELLNQKQAIEGEIEEDTQLRDAEAALAAAQEQHEAGQSALEVAEAQRSEADAKAERTREHFQEAKSEADRLGAEEAALARLLKASENNGEWPPMVDNVSVNPGYEAALGAALGDDLEAATDETAPVHWHRLDPIQDGPALPSGAVPLAQFVKAPPELARRLSQIGVVDDVDGPRLRNELKVGQRLVSREGSLWRWDGFTVSKGAETAAAVRLAQRNRLEDISARRAQVAGPLAQAEATNNAAKAQAEAANQALRQARDTSRNAEAALNKARNTLSTIERNTASRTSKLTALSENLQQLEIDLGESREALAKAEADFEALPEVDGMREQLGELRRKVADLRSALVEARNAQDQLRRDAQARANRASAIDGEIAAWRTRADNAGSQIAELAERRTEADSQLETLARKPAEIAEKRSALLNQIEVADAERNTAAEALAAAEAALGDKEKALRQSEQTLGTAREERVRAEAGIEQARERRIEIVRRITETLECRPEQVLAAAGVEEGEQLPGLEETEARVDRLKRERDRMGPVNLRAEQEAEELDEQLQTMRTEREDLEGAIARLRQGIASLNREGRERLLAAFKQVDEHFQELFVKLFGGGKAHLSLTESDDPLNAGLEIMASPPGKRLQNLSLLSGGEQALTALSLLFAVFMTNPAPVCVLDEVDAPLDDANVERFCDLVSRISQTTGTRFLVITHHPYTMARMDRLFGVTMAERGVSQLVSIDLERAERIRASA
jgi:chromosome segregation protein